eukprot:6543665-Alexandrium_andersonii.AAC.1
MSLPCSIGVLRVLVRLRPPRQLWAFSGCSSGSSARAFPSTRWRCPCLSSRSSNSGWATIGGDF